MDRNEFKEMVAYDFSNLDLQRGSNDDYCYSACQNCDCEGDNCDVCDDDSGL